MTIGLERLSRLLHRQLLRPRESASDQAPTSAREAAPTHEAASSASVKSWAWKAYLALGLALTAGYFALPRFTYLTCAFVLSTTHMSSQSSATAAQTGPPPTSG